MPDHCQKYVSSFKPLTDFGIFRVQLDSLGGIGNGVTILFQLNISLLAQYVSQKSAIHINMD